MFYPTKCGNWSFKIINHETSTEIFPLYFIDSLAIITACKKEESCEGCKENNKPPAGIAGPDQSITLPTDSITLDGSASSDPDGTISEWLWTKISGPASLQDEL